MLLQLSTVVISSLFFFQSAHAEEITPWNFQGQLPKQARTIERSSNRILAEITPQGLLVRTPIDGYLLWQKQPIKGPTDVVTIRARASKPTKASLLWLPADADKLVQLYFDIPASTTMQETHIIVAGYTQWNWQTEQLGIAFPSDSEVLIEEVQFRYWTFYERNIERWKSFWTFDTFHPYSINFLWGPLISGNTPQRATLYDELPPASPSAMRYVYIFLGIIAAGALIASRKSWHREKALGWFLIACISVWFVFDIRMSMEIISYAIHDIEHYVLPTEKRLRNYAGVHDSVITMAPDIQKHPNFAMLTPYTEVYFPLLRYYGYPSVIRPDPTNQSGATAWAVIDRTDVWVDDTKRLRLGSDPITATVLTPPGHVAVPINASTFLFVTP